jgi:hypothetical protein
VVSDLTTPPPEEEGGGRAVDEALAQDLVERARSEGVELVGPGGLLTDLDESAAALVRGAELGQAQRLSPFQQTTTTAHMIEMGCLPCGESSDSGVKSKGAGVLAFPVTAEPRERRKPDRDRHRLPSL